MALNLQLTWGVAVFEQVSGQMLNNYCDIIDIHSPTGHEMFRVCST